MSDPRDTKADKRFVAIPWEIQLIPKSELSFGAKILYCLLRLHAGLPPYPAEGVRQGPCYPNQQTLAKEMGVSERAVRDLLDELRECGLVTWRHTGRSNHYRIFPPSSFRPPTRKKSSNQTGRKLPVSSDETFRSERKSISDKKILIKQQLKGAAKHESVRFLSLDFYSGDEDEDLSV